MALTAKRAGSGNAKHGLARDHGNIAALRPLERLLQASLDPFEICISFCFHGWDLYPHCLPRQNPDFLVEAFAQFIFGDFQIVPALQVHPELCAGPEEPPQP